MARTDFSVCVFILIFVNIVGIDGRLVVDLTHTFDENAPKYPLTFLGADNFTYYKTTTLLEQYYGKMWIVLRKIEFYEHQGTHIDAPIHFGKGRQALEEIPVQRLVGPGVVIDIRDKVRDNPNYAITVEDIKLHEAEYGVIPYNSIIMMNSGWADYYPNSNLVFGTQNLSDPSTFNFPGWSLDACKMLLQDRKVAVLGVDTPSTDPGQPPEYHCHMYLQPNNVPLLEYVANLASIPPRGTTIVLGAMKVRRGTGGPTRIFALIDDDDDKVSSVPTSATSVCTMLLGVPILTFLLKHYFEY